MINTHNAQEEMNKENNANTSFVSEKSTSLDNNIKNQDEFDSETDDIDEKDSEIEIFSFEEMDDNNKIIITDIKGDLLLYDIEKEQIVNMLNKSIIFIIL